MKVITIKNSTISYNDKVVAPKLIINEEAFANALNATLVSRYTDDTVVKLHNSKNTLASAQKSISEYEVGTEERTKAEKTATKAQDNVNKYSAILDALRTEKKTIGNVAITDDLKEIVSLYSALFSTVGGINTEGNKTMTLTLTGIVNLFKTCKDYADKYEAIADIWTEERKNEFAGIKVQLEAIGTRLNGDTTENRKGFKYSASTKDVNRLVAFLTKHDDFSKSNGKIKEKRNDIYKFQHTVICTIFRMKEEDVQTADTIEF